MNTTPYTYVESLVSRQQKAEQELLAQLQNGRYTLEAPLVKLNPYLIAPLTALILFQTDVPPGSGDHGLRPDARGQYHSPLSRRLHPCAADLRPVCGL